jgi:hypothetical protein
VTELGRRTLLSWSASLKFDLHIDEKLGYFLPMMAIYCQKLMNAIFYVSVEM